MNPLSAVPPIKQTAPHTWESSLLLLYETDEQTQLYGKLVADRSYNSFHENTVELMDRYAAEICQYIKEPFTLVDLGPAYPDKTLPLMRYLGDHGIPFDYVPVDINSAWMNAAVEAAKPYARKTRGVNALFEKCASQLPRDCLEKRFVFIGLTFMNFEPAYIFNLMNKIAGPGGYVGVAQELITDEKSIGRVLGHYRSPASAAMCYSTLQHLGVREDELENFLPHVHFANNRMEVGFILSKPYLPLGMQAGDRLITIVSYRRTPRGFWELLNANVPEQRIWISRDQTTALAVAKL